MKSVSFEVRGVSVLPTEVETSTEFIKIVRKKTYFTIPKTPSLLFLTLLNPQTKNLSSLPTFRVRKVNLLIFQYLFIQYFIY